MTKCFIFYFLIRLIKSFYFFNQVSKKPSRPITTDLTLTSYGSTHSDLSDGVPL